MSTPADLHRAILADPDDDTLRLAYADCLQENATSEAEEDRAEFVKASVNMEYTANSRTRAKLRKRAAALIHKNLPAQLWPDFLPSLVAIWRLTDANDVDEGYARGRCNRIVNRFMPYDIGIRKGFPFHVSGCYWTEFKRYGGALCGSWPLTSVDLYGYKPLRLSEIGWVWRRGVMREQGRDSCFLPNLLFDRVGGYLNHEHTDQGQHKSYRTEEQAQSAVSAALLQYGQEKRQGLSRSRTRLPIMVRADIEMQEALEECEQRDLVEWLL